MPRFVECRKGKKWEVSWKNPWTGKRHTQRFEDEATATIFENAQIEIALKEKAILKKARKRKSENKKICIKELFETYFRMAHTNPTTTKQAQYHASHLITVFGNRLASRLSREDILNFSEAQRIRGIAQITANRRISILKAAINWGVKNGLIHQNPLADLKLPRARPRRIAPPTPHEAKAIFNAASPHVQRVITIGIFAGPRIGPSELFRLKWQDVDLGNAMFRMPSAEKNDLADGRDIPIKRAIVPIIKEWRKNDLIQNIHYVISWRGKPVKSISRAWHTALKNAGVERRIRPYDLRHAFATYALAGGADIGSVATLMGHIDASMILDTYQHVKDTQKRQAIEATPDILDLKKFALKI